jgi:3-oxoacyl-[acyl-carrier protein] reductase
MGDFEGLGALVTGAGRGIGRAIAVALAQAGARVGVVDVDGAAADVVAKDVDGLALAVDVRDAGAVDAAFDRTIDAFGRLDVVVNNAGIGDLRRLHAVDDDLWDEIVDVNLKGAFHGTRAAVQRFRGRTGAIVNVASLSGTMPTRGEAPYSAAKAAVIALTKSTALEYGPDVRANCVAPGFVRTDLTSDFVEHPEIFEPIASAMPLARMGEAHEIAEVVCFLASHRAGYITGQTIHVDGGLSLPQAGTDEALTRLMALYRASAST